MKHVINRLIVFISAILLVCPLYSQKLAVKTNLFSDVTTTINLGIEASVNDRMTVDVSGNYNPWTFSENKKLKHWIVQPEFRYWLHKGFKGHFLGAHLHGGEYNVGNIDTSLKILGTDLSIFKDNRYEGGLLGGGFTYGYAWPLSNRWSIEAALGLGYAYISYNRYDCAECGEQLGRGNYDYLGVTKLSLSIVYIIK
ncbi:DUF3575 domain-containing protein [Dysgonomonas sp. 521]|uniref:DUF3575 domain-containing protein n=1 Tax=Dysgonomonas sp. 521 TaxID=2302932 RepID=UPI0013CF85FA|nr:DUF3575 domain-containing protein [Dysgonomonas sp. 521]NDV94830.1 DUF3575 domain-containing protein [Dysgonomonas sp. 521]